MNSWKFLIGILFFALCACDKEELREEKYPNGQPKLRGYVQQDKDGNYLKTGTWVGWNKNGQKSYEEHFVLGKSHGKLTRWHKDGRIFSKAVFEQGLSVQHSFFKLVAEKNVLDEVIYYKDGKEDHRETYLYFDSGEKMSLTTWKDSEIEGKQIDWYETGEKASEGNYKAGKPHGESISWHKNGTKNTESYYENGKQQGKETKWYETGEKSSESYFQNGALHKLILFTKSGTKVAESGFKDGKLHGQYRLWFESGEKRAECEYLNGEELSCKCWSKAGKEVQPVFDKKRKKAVCSD